MSSEKSHSLDVSVIIAAWKARDCLEHAVRSALSQEGIDLEVIIVDDASPDGTYELALALVEKDNRVRAFRLRENGGPSSARNKAISEAKGRYVAVLDADDAYLPGRLYHLSKVADEQGADIIVDNIVRVDANGENLEEGPFLTREEFSQRHEISLERYIQCNTMLSNEPAIGYLKPLIRVSTLNKMTLRYDEALRNSEDYYLIAEILANKGKMIFDPIVAYAYRVDEGSISHRLTSTLTGKLVEAAQRFDRKYKDDLTEAEKRRAREHGLRFRQVHVFQKFLELLKAKKLIQASVLLLQHLSFVPFVIAQVVRSFKEKMARNR